MHKSELRANPTFIIYADKVYKLRAGLKWVLID